MTTFCIILAPLAVSSYLDGFWICGWLSKARLPTNLVLAVAAALGSLDLIMDDVRALSYQRRRMQVRGISGLTGLLAASASILLDRTVNIEIAYEMCDIKSVFQRWPGRPVRAVESIFAIQISLMIVLAMLAAL